ncbi:uncharacterized protein conserved in bacteria [Hahella chejuensis KCTC 2396]|uniref:Uncharacterized protein conserved in bacteria n=1 Tax=Hahella chejuensis (strain KCTC 2396) TaxID=349521 RepID=Q2SG86_HAHCH|nr:hypothetical protein [Hahella chejuensis]ABC30338.1 uncharacterized protein conserved in bacteria [Hahella chejuensis KCTC 2396]
MRKKYDIQALDYEYAKRWIDNKFHDASFPSETDAAPERRRRAGRELARAASHGSLNAWCEKWMSSREWSAMKNAIRAARLRREKQRGTAIPTRGVDLNVMAHQIVSALAKAEGVTISELIERKLKKDYAKLKKSRKA